jgi:hypothetical protein
VSSCRSIGLAEKSSIGFKKIAFSLDRSILVAV